MDKQLILVTDWEEVTKDDFYLSERWEQEVGEEQMKQARDLRKDGGLYYGYIVDPVHYSIYRQMDSDQVLINGDSDVIIHCETHIISDSHDSVMEYES